MKWKISGGKFKLDCEIPANASATVWLPQCDPARVREGGHTLNEAKGIKLARVDSGRPVLEVASGKFSLECGGLTPP